jgi:type IV pilus assembly protein PilE
MRGITLLELMVVVVIVGILAAIAYPNYRDMAARGKRNEAKACLLQIAAQQERFYLNNNQYTTDMTELGFPVASNFVTGSTTYTCDVTAADADNFTATATYNLADNEAGKCGTFQLDARGNRTSAPLTDCWTRTR